MNKYQIFYNNKNAMVEARTPYEAQKIGGELWRVKATYKIAWVLVELNGVTVDIENQIRLG